MDSQEVLLSICIPTYNGASSYLETVLNNTIALVEQYPHEVEIVVSDNASTDNTGLLIESFKDHQCLRAYRNEENIGFKRNLFLLTDVYSRGKYSWIIGDDDIIIPSVFPVLIEELRKNSYEYISLGSKIIQQSDLPFLINAIQKYHSSSCSYAKAIDYNCYEGNVLSTFMGGSVFITEKFKNCSKDFINSGFSDYRNVFPNGYILAITFSDSKCLCIGQTSIVSITREKGWASSDNVYLIFSKYLPDLYTCLLKKGVKKGELKKNKQTILYKAAMITLLRIRHGEPVNSVFPLFIKVLFCPSVLVHIVKNIIKV